MDIIVNAEEVSKKYGDFFALKDFSIEIPKGSVYGLLGPNGAGKTTFIRMLNQITLPDSGRFLFNGEPLQPKHISSIGYMPEERGLYKNMPIGEQMMYFAQLKGLSKKEAKKIIQEWLEKLDIADWWKKKVTELSKGMAQKIQFVVTILHQPQLLIFDEPFSGFDPMNAAVIRDEILQLKKNGATIIFSTHRMDTVEEMCDYVVLINKSKKVLDGKITDIKNRYKQNKFKAEIATTTEFKLMEELKSFSAQKLPSENGLLKLELQLADDEQIRELLRILSNHGRLVHFSEMIPDMNEIFIQTVKETSNR